MEQRTKYDLEFKAQTVQLCEVGDVAIAQVARDLGIDVKLLYRWRREVQHAGDAAIPGQGHSSEDEVKRLRRELARAEMEWDILRKALGVLTQPDSSWKRSIVLPFHSSINSYSCHYPTPKTTVAKPCLSLMLHAWASIMNSSIITR